MLRWISKWRGGASPPEREISEVIATLSALHHAGLSVARAWSEVASIEGTGAVPRAIIEAISAGASPHEAIGAVTLEAPESWRAVGACWAISRATGAPLSPALAALSEALRDCARTERAVAAALAGPQATMALVLALPLVGMLGSALGGGDSIGFLLTTALGRGLLCAGVIMMTLAWWWLRTARTRALPEPGALSLELDLFASACGGGALPERARSVVEKNLQLYRLTAGRSSELATLIALSRRAGVPVATLARSRAALDRDVARADAEHRLQRLGVAVVMPMGLLVLPAFVVLAVVPMAVGLWSGALG